MMRFIAGVAAGIAITLIFEICFYVVIVFYAITRVEQEKENQCEE